jgi:hypothetical protein
MHACRLLKAAVQKKGVLPGLLARRQWAEAYTKTYVVLRTLEFRAVGCLVDLPTQVDVAVEHLLTKSRVGFGVSLLSVP